MEPIREFNGRYRFLSNFYEYSFTFERQVYPTAEHAYQARKTFEAKWFTAIKDAKGPGQAKLLGNKCPMRPDWDHVKDEFMYRICRAKFEVPELHKALIATGDAELIEGNFWNDTYWGMCNGKGLNKLGEILMRIRHELGTGQKFL